MCFATNCFVARREWFLSEEYTRYFEAIDESGGFYLYRWGDACVHMLAVAALLPREHVIELSGLPYWHQGTVLLPSELQPAASVLLGGLTSPRFARGAASTTESGASGKALPEGQHPVGAGGAHDDNELLELLADDD